MEPEVSTNTEIGITEASKLHVAMTASVGGRRPGDEDRHMTRSTTAHKQALTILRELQHAQADLHGKGVVVSDGTAGTIDEVLLDDFHGLRITIYGHNGKWPVSAIKFAEES